MDNIGSPIEPKTENASSPTPRPASVTILVLGVLIIASLNITRLILGIKYWDFLVTWPGISPLYITLTGLLWALTGLLLLWGLYKAKNWAPRLMQAEALTYASYYWLDHIFLVDHPASGVVGAQHALLPVNWRFAAGMTVVCLAFTAWTLSRAKVKAYFGLVELKVDQNQKNGDDIG
jgi:hypothetical protein